MPATMMFSPSEVLCTKAISSGSAWINAPNRILSPLSSAQQVRSAPRPNTW